jgi:hypothetical protein
MKIVKRIRGVVCENYKKLEKELNDCNPYGYRLSSNIHRIDVLGRFVNLIK